jgi:Protein of unknown function (DUF4232)
VKRLFLSAAVVAAMCLPAIASATHTITAASVPSCTTSGLVVWMDTQGDGAAGTIYYKLEFTNQSGKTCSLYGYPGVSAVDLSGAQLGTAGSRDQSKVRTVRLANGATATAVLRVVEAGNFPSSTCHIKSAAGVRVYPPNQKASKVVPFPFSACSAKGPAILRVQAVT